MNKKFKTNSFTSFISEQNKIKQAREGKAFQFKKREDEELRDFMKNVLPLMSIKDLVGCLVMKCCNNEGVTIKGILYGENEYNVTIEKVEKENYEK